MMNNQNQESLSKISKRRTTIFSVGNNNSNFESDPESDYYKTNALESMSLKMLDEAISNIVDNKPGSPLLGVTGDKYFEPPISFNSEKGMIKINRPIYSQSKFSKIFSENDIEKKPHRFFDNVFVPITEERRFCDTFLSLFPLIAVLRTYNFRNSFPLDLLSGLTTGVMRIPQSMAYALLANLPPVFGLYTAFFSAILYPIFGGSNHMAAGAQGVVSLLIGEGVLKAVKQINFDEYCNDTGEDIIIANNISQSLCSEIILTNKINISITITFMVGLFQCLLGICRFGFLTNYLSDPLIGGLTTAAAWSVLVSQLPVLFGIKTESFTGVLYLWYLIADLIKKIHKTNIATLVISICCLLILIISKLLSSKFIHKIKVPIPGELLVMIGTILFTTFSEAVESWKVYLVGTITPGFMKPRFPDKDYLISTLEASISATIVSFTIGYSIAKRLALQHDYDINGNQEMFAFGFLNCIGSFFNAFAATASMSASALHDSLGGVSQIANIIASILILLALLFIGPLFESTPECVLSTIILINLKSILFQFTDLRVLWKVSKIDFLLWLVTFVAVIILDIGIGLGIGVLFSLLTIVFRTQWPYVCLLGRIPCTDIYKNINLTADAEEVPGIKIFRFEGSLYFASAEHFRNSLQKETGINATKIIITKRERENKLLKLKKLLDPEIKMESVSTHKLIDTNIIDLNCKDIHHIIIDFSTCSFIDSVGVRMLMQVIHDYSMADIVIFLANVRAAVRAMLNNSNVLYPSVNTKNIFISVHDAVLGALEDAQYITERNHIIKDAAIKSVTRCVSRIASDPDISQSYRFSRSEKNN